MVTSGCFRGDCGWDFSPTDHRSQLVQLRGLVPSGITDTAVISRRLTLQLFDEMYAQGLPPKVTTITALAIARGHIWLLSR